ncbi:MAG: threonine dehydratase, partial [Runella slithyformis]
KTARERGSALVGIELKSKDDFQPLIDRMQQYNIQYEYINEKPALFEFLI